MSALTVIATTPPARERAPAHRGILQGRARSGIKIELAAAIDDYRRSLVPLIVPITLIRHYVRFHEVPYLAGQIYLQTTSQGADASQITSDANASGRDR
jgi:uncharacterized protein YbgA (DUF1722 family)